MIGTTVANRYQCTRLLGEGGFGAVYLAQDSRLGHKQVAVKECYDTSQEAQDQFTLEAELLANLQNAGLPRVTDHFTEPNGHQYLVMDFIEGEDLDQRVSPGRPMAEREAARLMLQVCDAVAYLHTRRPQPVIHRDIKPANIKITPAGQAMLVDFGIAKLYHPAKRTARAARAVTPHFSSPEQYVGKTDTRSDVYSLGATLYFLVTAEPPPEGIDRVSKGAVLPTPRQLNPALSPDLEKILLKALELDPNKRYPNANHLAAALRNWLSGASPSAGTASIACPVCGYQNRPEARFCARDRTPLTSAAPVSAGPPSAAAAQPAAKTPPLEPVSPEMLFEFANVYAKNNDYPQAILRYETCLKQGFNDAAVYHNLGSSYRLSKRLEEALKILEEGAARYPQDGDIQFQLALTDEQRGQPDRALAAAARACALEPRAAEYHHYHGQLLFDAKQYTQAAGAFEQALHLDPKQAMTQFFLGLAYGESGDLNRAIPALRKAAHLQPDQANPSLWLGVYSLRAKNYRQAVQALNTAIRIEPQRAEAYPWLAEAYAQQGDLARMLAALEKAVALEPKNADYLSRLALGYARLNRSQEARQAAQQALTLDPANQAARELLKQI